MGPVALLTIRKEPYYRRQAFESGLRKLGYKIVDHISEHPRPRGPDDLLVLWNRKQGPEEQHAEKWEAHGGTVIVAENGYLQAVDKTHYALSTHQHNGAGWFPVGTEDRFKVLDFEVKPWRTGGDHILVCAQRGIGSALMASPMSWAEKTVKQLSAGWNVRLRPHPGNFPARVPLIKDLENVWVCVIWSGAAGVRALVEGVPVTYAAPHWVCAEAASRGVRDAASMEAHRVKSLHKMSHGQWHFSEIASGEPFARMKAEGWGPREWGKK